MNDDHKIYVPARPLAPGDRYGIFSDFEPGTRTFPAGTQIAPPFRPVPVDIVFEKDIAVTLRDGVTIHVDVLRPAGTEKVPVIVAWSPYGKGQGTSPSVMGVFALVGLDNERRLGAGEVRGSGPGLLVRAGLRDLQPRHPRRGRLRGRQRRSGTGRRAATATT